MPNNVVNEVIFRSVNCEDQESILKKVLKNGFIDFNILVPTPLNIWQGNIGQKEKDAFGNKNWHDWNTENWGTKWNAYGKKENVENIVQTDDTLTFTFFTAWSPPRQWLCTLLNATEFLFKHNWLSEGNLLDVRTGRYYFSGEGECRSPAWEEAISNDKNLLHRLQKLLYGPDYHYGV